MKTTYRHAGIGGTFDHFHAGHELLITTAFQKADFVSIGIATEGLFKEKNFNKSIQSYAEREQYIKSFLQKNHWSARATLFPLDDIYGTAITDETIDTLIVTKETKPNALRINNVRKQCQLPPCNIIVIPFVKGAKSRIIRSSRIRAGLINRQGMGYLDILTQNTKMILPKNLRDTLREPLGVIIEGTDNKIDETGKKAAAYLLAQKPLLTISVGDISTLSLQNAGLTPDVSIVDFKTRRTYVSKTHSMPQKGFILNPAGTLCKLAIIELNKLIQRQMQTKKPTQLIIKGEEDLLTLPAVLLSPLGSAIVYGQYDVGLIVVMVDEKVKTKVADLIKQFE